MFFISFSNIFKTPSNTLNGTVKIPKISVSRSAIRYPK